MDKILGESLRYSERHSSKVFSTKYDWSPILNKAVNTLHFWTLCLKRAKGIRVSDNRLLKAQTTSDIEIETLPHVLPLPYIVKHLRKSRATLKDLQKRHEELRQSHLQ